MASRKVTIKDVAREAGVSISTVSNALNGVDVLHPDTKQHILEVADRLHYIPNLNGRNLKSQATKVIGLFLTSIKGPYYGVLADSIYQSCKKNGYELNIFISDKADNMMTNILGKRIDGAIILNEFVREKEIGILLENEVPIVFIDREQLGENVSSVVFDSYHEGELAAKYLLELGHTTFGYMRGVENNFDNSERLRGFQNILGKAGITLQEDYILNGAFEREAAYNSMKDFLELGKPLPEAIFAANDESAIGTITALMEEGIKVPEQVSIMGCDDIEAAQLIKPSITTIRTSFEKQGILAVNHLIALIKGEEGGCIEVLHGRIIPRESTCPRE
ncbi:MAG: LacI family DNA-binding transcriptional regulator [Lachnospiraceae bacterium]|nr:LacI family DNA-binding transcriptional regulator [Lachnospiraceae bacterium]